MKYMLLMNNMTTGDTYAGVSGWREEDIQAHIVYMKEISASLRESGELVSTEGLEVPTEAKVVRAGKNGEPITDGVFPESKEFLAGYWIVDVAGAEQAYRIAARASAAPGPNGSTLSMPIEVRRIMSRTPDGRIPGPSK
jgi:hypothetical protein